MSKEKIAIIGANEAITMLIEKAKVMGYETHVFAWQCGDHGEKVADFFYPINVADKESILNKCRELGVVGVCSITSDFTVPTVNYVARNLGLTCNPERTDIVARNKYKMRCAFKEAGLYTPVFYEVGSDFQQDDLANINYPVVVKPIDRWSSKGVTRVDYLEGLDAAVKTAVAESFDKKAIIEEFMNGPEYSAECICYRGEYCILAFTQKQTTGYPHYIETGHMQPSDIPKEKQEYIKQTVCKALKALDIQNGAAHAEFRILDNGEIGIIEIGARMGGDCIGTDLTQISTGMDYIRMVVEVACGKKPDFCVVTQPMPVMVKFIIENNDINTFKTVLCEKPTCIVRYSEIDNQFNKQVIDSSTRHGYYIVVGGVTI